MANYYVALSGNDTTGDGSASLPWRTINKALTTATLTVANTINVDAGTYAENSGANYLDVTQDFVVNCVIQPWHDGDAVILTDNASGNYCLRLNACSFVEFKDLTIQPAAENTIATVFFQNANTSNITFTDCTIRCHHATSNKQIFRCSTITNTISGIVLDGCTLEQVAAGGNTLIGVSVKVGDGGTVDITLNDCTVTGYGAIIAAEFLYTHANATLTVTIDGGTYTSTGTYACQVLGGTVDISNATFTNTALPALALGRDNVALYTTTGTVDSCTVSSTTSHALLLGGGSNTVTVTDCTITGGDYGVVMKEAVDCTLTGCTINEGTVGSVYFKAGIGCTVDDCSIRNTVGGDCIRLAVNPDSATKSGTCTVTNCKVHARGTSSLFDWGDAADDSGGGICNLNEYGLSDGATWGTVYGSAVTSLATLRAAWATYDVTTNDASSDHYKGKVTVTDALV